MKVPWPNLTFRERKSITSNNNIQSQKNGSFQTDKPVSYLLSIVHLHYSKEQIRYWFTLQTVQTTRCLQGWNPTVIKTLRWLHVWTNNIEFITIQWICIYRKVLITLVNVLLPSTWDPCYRLRAADEKCERSHTRYTDSHWSEEHLWWAEGLFPIEWVLRTEPQLKWHKRTRC